MHKLRNGMEVYGPDNTLLGKIENFADDVFHLNGHKYNHDAISRVDNNRVYLSDSGYKTYNQYGGSQYNQNSNEIRVPVAEERLNVEKRAGQVGEVRLNKTVHEEQQTIPVELRREEANVEVHDLPDRPLRAGETTAFQEGTIRVPLQGEQAYVTKEAVVTGEVAVQKNQTTERRDVSDTVRREEVNVDRQVRETRGENFTTNEEGYSSDDQYRRR